MSDPNENRIKLIFDLVQEGNVKKALKQIQQYTSKKHTSVDKCYFNTATALVYEQMNKLEEAHSLLEDTIKSIIDQKMFSDYNLVDHVGIVAKELGCFDKVLQLYEKIQQANPGNKQMAEKLFNSYCGENEYYKTYMIANQIASKFNDPKYSQHAAVALYFFSKSEAAPPGTIEMAKMNLDMIPKDNRGIADIYVSLLKDKLMFKEAIEFINTHESLYPLAVERKRLVTSLYEKAGDDSKAIELMLQIIRENYQVPKQFQSIYDLHEVIICKILKSEGKVNLDISKQNSETPFSEATVQNLYSSFYKYLNYFPDDKTSEAHNVRKSGLLSVLLLFHKLNLKKLIPGEQHQQILYDLALKYLEAYPEMPSAVIDVSPFICQLSDRLKFCGAFKQAIEEKKVDSPLRQLRMKLTHLKVSKVLGQFKFASREEFVASQSFKDLVTTYQEGLGTDDKPAKGERKAADDAIQIILEILEELPTDQGSIQSTDVLVHAFAENLLEASEFNYDVKLRQIFSYKSIGAFSSYKEKIVSLDLKGVQLESMGSLHLNNTIENFSLNNFTDYLIKFDKYSRQNIKDLKAMKYKSFSQQNYQMLEEFNDYGSYLDNSYHFQLVKFIKQQKSIIENLNDEEWLKTYFTQRYSQLLNDAQKNDYNYSQDLDVLKPKFEVLPSEFSKVKRVVEFSKYNSQYLNTITQDDPLLKYFKYDNRSNYKPFMFPTYSIYEDSKYLQIKYQLLTKVSQQIFKSKAKEESKEEVKGNDGDNFEIGKSLDDYLASFDQVFLNQVAPILRIDIGASKIIDFALNISSSIAKIVENKADQDKAVKIIDDETAPLVTTFCKFSLHQLKIENQIGESLFQDLDSMTSGLKRKLLSVLSLYFLPIFIIILRDQTTLKDQLSAKKKKKGAQGPNVFAESVKTKIQQPLKESFQNLISQLDNLVASLKDSPITPSSFVEQSLISSERFSKEDEVLRNDIQFNQQQLLVEVERIVKQLREGVKQF